MTTDELLQILADSPLIPSVQPSAGIQTSAETLAELSQVSLQAGSKILRLEGTETIQLVKSNTDAIVMGLIKKLYPDSKIHITPSTAEVRALLALDCEAVALDATARQRPNGESLADLVALIHAAGKVAIGDTDSLDSARYAKSCGCDMVSTALAGYTDESIASSEPDLLLVRELAGLGLPVLAEGRFSQEWHASSAIRLGAVGVVIGGALNDPYKNGKRFITALNQKVHDDFVAFDLGGTLLRSMKFSPSGEVLSEASKRDLPQSHSERLAWIKAELDRHQCKIASISAGGQIKDNKVIDCKDFIGDYLGASFELGDDYRVIAINDGLATAWGHRCLPQNTGKRVASLALGTGVGFGFADTHDLYTNSEGDYPRLNDLPVIAEGTNHTVETLIGGIHVSKHFNESTFAAGARACLAAIHLLMPDILMVCGGVGLSLNYKPYLDPLLEESGMNWQRSPYGSEAGLIGAASVAIDPPSCLKTHQFFT